MGVKKTGLGRGLEELLSTTDYEPAAPPSQDALRSVPLDRLVRGAYQPRQDMRRESLEELAESIRAQGIVQPIVVRPLKRGGATDSGQYEIVAGERRWRAAQLAGLADVPVIVRDIPDSAVIAVALIENIQREDLNPLEEALALRRLIDEFEMTHQEAATAIGRSRAAVSNLLRLLELSEDAKALLQSRELEMGHARALLALTDAPRQAEAARLVATKGLSVRETERLVRRMLQGGSTTGRSTTGIDPDIRRLQDELTGRLGARVAIQHGAHGKGKLVISYNSADELQGILEHIK
jgi:ParB family chromosome partitioning protein